jgi:hypothetical protein
MKLKLNTLLTARSAVADTDLRAQRYRSCWSSRNETAAADDARQAPSLMLSEGMLPLKLLQCRLSLTSCCV